MKKSSGELFEGLLEIMKVLRGPNGCPWDKEQTYRDINPYMLEEVHEVMEAIDKNDMNSLKEELGDLLLHIVFHAQMATEDGVFDINDVLKNICEKLVRRHPHVFGSTKAKNSDDVIKNWEQIKIREGTGKTKKSILGGVPRNLPALLKAYRLGEKASRVNFDWPDADGILNKLNEEIRELNDARTSHNREAIEHEFGDILFTLANIGRFLKINPEDALRKTTNKFIKRFQWIEKALESQNESIKEKSLDELDQLWEEAKKNER